LQRLKLKKKKRRKKMNSLLHNARRRCTQTKEKLFSSLVRDGFKQVPCPKQGNNYYFKDNGGKILLVAHADTVRQARKFGTRDGMMFSPMLDDRLGVAIVVDMLPSLLSAPVDILITDDEEVANSSALSFVSKGYNWIAEFDRGGGDVVTYGIESDKWLERLETSGFFVGEGIYSDICDIDDTCCMVNVGVGYQKYHSMKAYADTQVAESNIARFIKFFDAQKDVWFEAERMKTSATFGKWDDDEWWEENKAYSYPCYGCNGPADDFFIYNGDEVPMCEYCASMTHAEWAGVSSDPINETPLQFEKFVH